jgi:hypothetical protein
LLVLVGAWGLLVVVQCHLPRQSVRPTPDSTSAVHVVRHGWHAGIVVRRADVPDTAWPLLGAFPDARSLEVGWGEAGYYTGRSRGGWGTVRAGAWPTESVLHVVPVPGGVQEQFPSQTIVRVPVGPGEIDALTSFVAASFAVDSTGRASVVAPGHDVNSRFYASPLPYHIFNNCNHWAAAALEAAGCAVWPRGAFTVEQVMAQARACGTLVQRGAPD